VHCAVLAEAVVFLHFAFVLFVVLGGICVLFRYRFIYAHLPALAWGIAIELGGWICPLTPLENTARRCAGQAGYSGSFLRHYLLDILYPDGFDRTMQLQLAGLLVAFNLAIYIYLFYRRRKTKVQDQA